MAGRPWLAGMVKEMYGYRIDDINHEEIDNDLVSNIPCNVPL